MYDERRDGVSGTSEDPMGRSPALHAYAVCMFLSILVLICSGGLVTSNDAGLAVPDWPTSYGYNMFAFPLSRWLAPGGVRLEHSHRLIATGEGVLTIILAAWAWNSEPRRWVRTLAYATLGAVIFQGVLGGLRVVLRADWIGIFHACFAQAFLALVSVIALVTSRWWWEVDGEGRTLLGGRRPPGAVTQVRSTSRFSATLPPPDDTRVSSSTLNLLARKLLVTAILIYVQLGLGAAMRHAHAGLSIPDFPKAYGHWWPQVHQADLPALNEQRDAQGLPQTTLAQIHLQMTHRLNAVLILGSVLAVASGARRRRALLPDGLRRLATAGVALVAAQITLGICTIWTNKAADVATAHVAVGALLFVWSVVSYVALRRWMEASALAGNASVMPLPSRTLEAVA